MQALLLLALVPAVHAQLPLARLEQQHLDRLAGLEDAVPRGGRVALQRRRLGHQLDRQAVRHEEAVKPIAGRVLARTTACGAVEERPQHAQHHAQADVVARLAERVQHDAAQRLVKGNRPRVLGAALANLRRIGRRLRLERDGCQLDHVGRQLAAVGAGRPAVVVRHHAEHGAVHGERLEEDEERVRVGLDALGAQHEVPVQRARLVGPSFVHVRLEQLVHHERVGRRHLARPERLPQPLQLGQLATVLVVVRHERKRLERGTRHKRQVGAVCRRRRRRRRRRRLVLCEATHAQLERPVHLLLAPPQVHKQAPRFHHAPREHVGALLVGRRSRAQPGTQQTVDLHRRRHDAARLHKVQDAVGAVEVAGADEPLEPLAKEEVVGHGRRQFLGPRALLLQLLLVQIQCAGEHHVDKDVEGVLGMVGRQEAGDDLVVVLNLHTAVLFLELVEQVPQSPVRRPGLVLGALRSCVADQPKENARVAVSFDCLAVARCLSEKVLQVVAKEPVGGPLGPIQVALLRAHAHAQLPVGGCRRRARTECRRATSPVLERGCRPSLDKHGLHGQQLLLVRQRHARRLHVLGQIVDVRHAPWIAHAAALFASHARTSQRQLHTAGGMLDHASASPVRAAPYRLHSAVIILLSTPPLGVLFLFSSRRAAGRRTLLRFLTCRRALVDRPVSSIRTADVPDVSDASASSYAASAVVCSASSSSTALIMAYFRRSRTVRRLVGPPRCSRSFISVDVSLSRSSSSASSASASSPIELRLLTCRIVPSLCWSKKRTVTSSSRPYWCVGSLLDARCRSSRVGISTIGSGRGTGVARSGGCRCDAADGRLSPLRSRPRAAAVCRDSVRTAMVVVGVLVGVVVVAVAVVAAHGGRVGRRCAVRLTRHDRQTNGPRVLMSEKNELVGLIVGKALGGGELCW
ncbi:hypothetical protein SPBR_04665 [Sporothrix brasiliensis 5110]|uniref:Uncharacterized protein n=1 Tax=Sporothrix brasiliensis 5110 TaxID=1398154 RepID=A0A0C2ILE8_9PEZI|nr:uncharacterized protein SPBR_04665 [Sporothrix brasiliensis 5110]KIH87820.1 hypothetical protein SPBR_04665 [Sporothrix brasiliensis 5110]